MAEQSTRWHGIFNQQGVTDFDYKDSIEGPWNVNIFRYILRHQDGGTEYLNNLYKFWAMGQLKRQWIWCDYKFEEGRENVPFPIDWNTGKYYLDDLKSNYKTRFIDILRQLTQYGLDKGQDVHVVITLFEFHISAWQDQCGSSPCQSTWCKTGACVLGDPVGCVPCSSIQLPPCNEGLVPVPIRNGNPWYPGNNEHNLSALPWGHNSGNKLSIAFFPPPLSDSESAEGELYTKQTEYVTNICDLIKQAYDLVDSDDYRDTINRERVIIELMHEPPVPENSSYAAKMWDWFGGIRSHIYSQFTAGLYQPLIAMQFNNEGLLLETAGSVNFIDIVTTEADANYVDTWWDGNCSTAHMADWVGTLNLKIEPDVDSSEVILDTDGNACRENNPNLSSAADEANSNEYSFVHLEDYTTDVNGNALRDTLAIDGIAKAYDDCLPFCPPQP